MDDDSASLPDLAKDSGHDAAESVNAPPPTPPTPSRVNACPSAPDEAVQGYCILCGRAGRGWKSLDTPDRPSSLRCDACYSELVSGALYCGQCGRAAPRRELSLSIAHETARRECIESDPRVAAHAAPTPTDVWSADLAPVKNAGWFYAAMLAPILALYGWASHVGRPPLAADIVVSALLYCVIGVFAWRHRTRLLPLLQLRNLRPRALLIVVLATPPFSAAVLTFFHFVLLPLLGGGEIGYSDEWIGAGFGWWVVYIDVSILPAFFEEIAFRGILLAQFERVMSSRQALFVTALLFATIHYSVISFLVLLVPLGLAAGWLTQRYRSLWPAILLHALHNAAVVLTEQFHL